MWKKEDLQNSYVKLSNQQDYEVVVKVLHEFGFTKAENSSYNEKYYERFPIIGINNNTYHTLLDCSFSNFIPIQQFYDYNKPLKVEDLVEGEIYKSSYGTDWVFKYNKSNNETVYYVTPTTFSKSSWGFYKNKSITPATTEEKKWLNVCIKQNKFIPKIDLDLYDDVTFELKTIQPKFEVGKWYKITDCRDTYRKCSDSTFTSQYMPYNERIENTNYHKDNGSCGIGNNRLQLLTDLSEIQQYLPDNHVDKIIPMELSLVDTSLKYISNEKFKEQLDNFDKGKYPLTPNEIFKIDNNQVNLLVKQINSVTLKRTENEVNIKVNNLKTIKI